eukprot:gene42660-52919_t
MLCTTIFIDPRAKFALTVLNYILILTSFFVFLLYLVVRVWVNFTTQIEEGRSVIGSVMYTICDGFTIYHLIFMGLAIGGLYFPVTLTFLLLDFVTKSPTSQDILSAVYNPRKQIFMTIVLTFFFFNNLDSFTDDSISRMSTLLRAFKFYMRWGFPYGSPNNYMDVIISNWRLVDDVMFFIATMLMLNILKGITIDTFVELRRELEIRVKDTSEKCFICGIEKNTFNRTLDREAFRTHIKTDQNLWNYLYFIIYIWEQDKDDDDGLESYVRRCVEEMDLVWFPTNKAIRLTEHLEKGDVNSLKYKFRKDLQKTEATMQSKLTSFKAQLSGTIARVEKALEYEHEGAELLTKGRRATARAERSRTSASQDFTVPMTPSVPPPPPLGSGSGSIGKQKQFVRVASASTSARDSFKSNSDTSSERVPSAPRLLGDIKSQQRSFHQPAFNAMDADSRSQMHMRVVSISGMNIRKEHLSLITIRISSDFHATSL